MAAIPHIKLTIRRSELDGGGMYRTATVRNVELSGIAESAKKYVPDIIMHALSLAPGVEIGGNNGFTYIFPFKLS